MKHDGGPAFPAQWVDRDSTGEMVVRESYPGMSLRDYLAAHATDQDIEAHMHYNRGVSSYTRTPEQARYSFADDMLKARR